MATRLSNETIMAKIKEIDPNLPSNKELRIRRVLGEGFYCCVERELLDQRGELVTIPEVMLYKARTIEKLREYVETQRKLKNFWKEVLTVEFRKREAEG